MQSQDIIYKDFITLSGFRQNGTEFHLGQPGSCNHHLRIVLLQTEAVAWSFAEKKVFLKVSCNFIKKETETQIFFFEFCKVFKNTFFIEHILWLLQLREINIKIAKTYFDEWNFW